MTDKARSLLGFAMRAGKVRLGVFLTKRAIEDGSAQLVILPEDMGGDNRHAIEVLAKEAHVRTVNYKTKAELGKTFGKDSVAALAVCDEGFAASILKEI